MHASRHVCLPLALVLAAGLGACATTDPVAGPDIPAGAVESTRTYENGDVLTEYRVAGQLRVVRVQPPRGPAYFLYDRNGDGRLDESEGEGPVSPVYFELFEW